MFAPFHVAYRFFYCQWFDYLEDMAKVRRLIAAKEIDSSTTSQVFIGEFPV